MHKLKFLEYLQKDYIEVRAFTFGGTEGSMLGRRGWFDALSKDRVRCWKYGYGFDVVTKIMVCY